MITAIILVLIVLFLVIIYGEIRKYFINRKLGNFESPKQVPILGIANRFIGKSNDDVIETFFGMFDEVKSSPIKMWLGPVLTIGEW